MYLPIPIILPYINLIQAKAAPNILILNRLSEPFF